MVKSIIVMAWICSRCGNDAAVYARLDEDGKIEDKYRFPPNDWGVYEQDVYCPKCNRKRMSKFLIDNPEAVLQAT